MICIDGEKIRVCVIGVFFGKLPNYFPLWLKSAEKNSNIDFLLFCDDSFERLPPNVRLLPSSLEEIRQRANRVLGFETALFRPYKCCDFRPAYGLIFQEELKEYHYWGHCDLDVVWGDLESLLINNHLTKYDKFSYLGHFSLYRNSVQINNAFRLDGSQKSYAEVFSHDENYVFDEMPGMYQIFLKNNLPMFSNTFFADISSLHKRFRIIPPLTGKEKILNYKEQVFLWNNGRVLRIFRKKGTIHEEDFGYIHFKKRPNFVVKFDCSNVSCFAITHMGFFDLSGMSNEEILERYAFPQSRVFEGLEVIAYYRKRLLNRLKKRCH